MSHERLSFAPAVSRPTSGWLKESAGLAGFFRHRAAMIRARYTPATKRSDWPTARRVGRTAFTNRAKREGAGRPSPALTWASPLQPSRSATTGVERLPALGAWWRESGAGGELGDGTGPSSSECREIQT